MYIIDIKKGKMKCKICGSIHFAAKISSSSWECKNGCRLPFIAEIQTNLNIYFTYNNLIWIEVR